MEVSNRVEVAPTVEEEPLEYDRSEDATDLHGLCLEMSTLNDKGMSADDFAEESIPTFTGNGGAEVWNFASAYVEFKEVKPIDPADESGEQAAIAPYLIGPDAECNRDDQQEVIMRHCGTMCIAIENPKGGPFFTKAEGVMNIKGYVETGRMQCGVGWWWWWWWW